MPCSHSASRSAVARPRASSGSAARRDDVDQAMDPVDGLLELAARNVGMHRLRDRGLGLRGPSRYADRKSP